MPFIIMKYLITAAVIVLASELAKRQDHLGALVASMPLVTLLVLFWLHHEQQSVDKIANHAWYTFWYVLPTLPMFFCFPFLLPQLGFWPTMAVSVVILVSGFGILMLVSEWLSLSLFGPD